MIKSHIAHIFILMIIAIPTMAQDKIEINEHPAQCEKCQSLKDQLDQNSKQNNDLSDKAGQFSASTSKRYQKSFDFFKTQNAKLRGQLAECQQEQCTQEKEDDGKLSITSETTESTSQSTTTRSGLEVGTSQTTTSKSTKTNAETYYPPSFMDPEVIPPTDDDLNSIKDKAANLISQCKACTNFMCPKTDCAEAAAQLQKLTNLEQLLKDLITALEEAHADAGIHFLSLSESTMITGTVLASKLYIVAWTEFFHEFSVMLQNLVSLMGNLKDFGDFKKILTKDPKAFADFMQKGKLGKFWETVKGIDSTFGAIKDAAGEGAKIYEGAAGGKKDGSYSRNSTGAKTMDGMSDSIGDFFGGLGSPSVEIQGQQTSLEGYDVRDDALDIAGIGETAVGLAQGSAVSDFLDAAKDLNLDNPEDVLKFMKEHEDAMSDIAEDMSDIRLNIMTIVARTLTVYSDAQIKRLKHEIDMLSKSQEAETSIRAGSLQNMARTKQRLDSAEDALSSVQKAISSLTGCVGKLCDGFSLQRPRSIYDGAGKGNDCTTLRANARKIDSTKLTTKDLKTLKKYYEGCSPAHILKKLNPSVSLAGQDKFFVEIIEDCPDDESPQVRTCSACESSAVKLVDAILEYRRLKKKAEGYSKSIAKRYDDSLKALLKAKNDRETDLAKCEVKKCERPRFQPFDPIYITPINGYQSEDYTCPFLPICPACDDTARTACKYDAMVFRAKEDLKYVDRILKPRRPMLVDAIRILDHRLTVIRHRIEGLRELKKGVSGALMKAQYDLDVVNQSSLSKRTRFKMSLREKEMKKLDDEIKKIEEAATKEIKRVNPLLARAVADFIDCNHANPIPCEEKIIPLPPEDDKDYVLVGDPQVTGVIIISGVDLVSPEEVDPTDSTSTGGLFSDPTDTTMPAEDIVSTPTPAPTPTPVPAGLCSSLSAGSFSGDGGCGLNSTSISASGADIVLNPFSSGGANGATTFSGSGNSGTAGNTNLTIFGASSHTCTISCSGSGFAISCSNPSGGSCSEGFTSF